ncbi:MAG: EAL domain-containing protein [Roseiarcus sp.]
MSRNATAAVEAETDSGTANAHTRAVVRALQASMSEQLAAAETLRASREEIWRAALDLLPQGVAVFDANARLVCSNRRLAEIYRLSDDQLRPRVAFSEIIRSLAGAGTLPIPVDDSLAHLEALEGGSKARSWTARLADGRYLRISNRPVADGGWVSTHDDVTDLFDGGSMVGARFSMQALIDLVPDNLWIKDAESRFVMANGATAQRMGFADGQYLVGKSDLELCPPETANKYIADERSVIATGRPMLEKEEYILNPDGGKTWIVTTKVPIRSAAGDIVGLVGVSHDVTARRLADGLRDGQAAILEMIALNAPLAEVLDRLARLIESQAPGVLASILLLDEDGRRLRHGAAPNLPTHFVAAFDGVEIGPNAGCCGTAAHRREPVVVDDIAESPLWADYRELAASIGVRSCWSTPITSHQGQVLGTFALYSRAVRRPTTPELRLIDIATRIAGIAIERKLAEERIHFMATHDALTGLPNRSLLKDRISQAQKLAQRCDRWACVVFIDLDNFKEINDTLGHSAGDEILQATASRIVARVRQTDTVARIGGDEFVIVLADLPKDAEAISSTLQAIQSAIAAPVVFAGQTLRVTSSIGVATFPDDGATAEALLANADSAMYRAKDVGRDNIQFYTPEMNSKVQEKLRLREELRLAISRREFVLFYQPQFDLRAKAILAVEALIRWRHPSRGLLSPAQFVPLAEETGLIVAIGEWVINEACRQAVAWRDEGLPPIRMSVNVSARQFRDGTLTGMVADALRTSGLDPKYLELELTESLIMQNVEQAVETMKKLQALGVQLSIDDFGTGYSSLSALKTFPVARLKIDKSFVDGLPNDRDDSAVASAVISLGQKLDLKVIAEGVETEAQMAFLSDNDCDEIQGYYLSRPIPADDFVVFYRSRVG